MAAGTGRELKVKRNSVLIAAVVSKTISINNEPIDITSDDDSGFRKLLEASGMRSIDISVEGVSEDDVLLTVAAAAAPTLITADEVEFQSGATITGNFRFNNLEITGEVAGRIEFSASLQSSEAWTFTP